MGQRKDHAALRGRFCLHIETKRARKRDRGHTAGRMPPVTHNMILGPRVYHVANRGIPACGEGILGGSRN
eukprot:COSAG06_NODE_87_length_24962_cov_107.553795_27_plen_70_part_00